MNKYRTMKCNVSMPVLLKYRDELMMRFRNEDHLHTFIRCGGSDHFFGMIQETITVQDMEKHEKDMRIQEII